MIRDFVILKVSVNFLDCIAKQNGAERPRFGLKPRPGPQLELDPLVEKAPDAIYYTLCQWDPAGSFGPVPVGDPEPEKGQLKPARWSSLT